MLKRSTCAQQLAEILTQGVHPDCTCPEGSTLLHRADLSAEVVQLLLEHGANPDTGWFMGFLRTPLFFATQTGVPTLLVQAGADLERRDVDGLTPLLFNIEYGCVAMVEELLTLGADWKVTDLQGLGFLDYATAVPSQDVAQQLQQIHRRLVAYERRQSLLAALPGGFAYDPHGQAISAL